MARKPHQEHARRTAGLLCWMMSNANDETVYEDGPEGGRKAMVKLRAGHNA